MAIPTVTSRTTVRDGSSSTSTSILLPNNSKVAGKVIVVIASAGVNGAMSVTNPTGGGSGSVVYEASAAGSGRQCGFIVWKYTVTGNESAWDNTDDALTLNHANGECAAIVLCGTGAADFNATIGETAGGTGPNPANFAPGWGSGNHYWVTGTGLDNNTFVTVAPSGFTILENIVTGFGGSGTSVCRQTTPAAASSIDPGAFTLNQSDDGFYYTGGFRETNTVSGSFTGDAVLRAEIAGSLTGNAVVFVAQSGSFTGDAIIEGRGSFTGDAIISVARTGSLVGDAVISVTQTSSLTGDAIIGGTPIEGSFTADAWILAERSGSFTGDAVILATIAGSFVGDAVVIAEQTGSFTGDASIVSVVSGSLTSDAVVLAERTGTFTGDAVISVAQTGSFTGDAYISAPSSGSFTADAVIKATVSGSLTGNAIIRKTRNNLASPQYITKANNTGSGASVSVTRPSGIVNGDLLIAFVNGDEEGIARTITASGWTQRAYVFSAGHENGFWLFTKTAASEPSTWSFAWTGFSSSMAVGVVVVRDGELLSWIDGTGSGTSATSGSLLVELEEWIAFAAFTGTAFGPTATWNLGASLTEVIDVSTFFASLAVGYQPQFAPATVSYSVTTSSSTTILSLLLGVVGRSLTGDAVIRATIAGSFTADAVITNSVTVSGSFTGDAIILATRTGSFTGNAVIRAERTGSLTGDAVLRVAQAGSFTGDAWIDIRGSLTGDAVILTRPAGSFTGDAQIFHPQPYSTGSVGSVVILLDGDDITADVEYAQSNFTCLADGNVGRASVRIRDKGHTYTRSYLRAGKTLELYIDGEREWDGWVFTIGKGWPFDAGTGKEPEDEPRYWLLGGLDRNLLLQKRILYRLANPTDVTGIPDYPEDTPDRTAILDILDTYLDISGDGLDLSGIKHVASPGPFEDFTLGYIGATWGTIFEDAAKITGAVYWIGPDRVVRYVGDTDVTAPYPLSDVIEGRAVRYRELDAALDWTDPANDGLVWGAGVSSPLPAFGRHQDASSIADHGRWQWGDIYIGGGLDLTVERRARTYVEGSPSHRRGHNEPVPVVRCVIHRPGFRVGYVVDFRAHLFDYQQNLPIRSVNITFPQKNVARYELELTLRVDEPFGVPDLWSPDHGPERPEGPDGENDTETGDWTLVDHFDQESALNAIMGVQQGVTAFGTSHTFVLPDGSGYPGGVVGGFPTGRRILLFQLTTGVVGTAPSGGVPNSMPSPWTLVASQTRACTHASIFNTGHPNISEAVWSFDVDANPGTYPETGATVNIGSSANTEVLYGAVLVWGVGSTTSYRSASSTDWDIPDWTSTVGVNARPPAFAARRALYFSVAYNQFYDHLDHPGLGVNPEDHDTSIVTGGPGTSTGIDGVFDRLVAAVNGDETLFIDVGYSPINTGSGIPAIPMTGYTGTGGSQKQIINQMYGLVGGDPWEVLRTPGPEITAAWPELQPGGNRYFFDDSWDVVDSNLLLESGVTMDVRTGPYGVIDDASGPFSPVAQGDRVVDADAPVAPWATLPLDLLWLLTVPEDAYSFLDLYLIRFDPDGDVSAVIDGSPYRAAWMGEVELAFDFFDGAAEFSLYTSILDGTGILPELHADPSPTDSVVGNVTFHKYAPWNHRWDVDLDGIYPWEAGAQYYVQLELGKAAYDAAAGAWYIRARMWRFGESMPDWQVEDVFAMYKPAAATYLGETNITGAVATTDGFEYGYHEWYGDDMDIDAWWTKQGKGQSGTTVASYQQGSFTGDAVIA